MGLIEKNRGGLKTRTKIITLGLLLIFTTMIIISASPVSAAGEDDEWITSYTVEDDSGQVLLEYDASTNETSRFGAIVPGTDITVTFTVNVIASGEGNLKLTTYLAKPSSGAYWHYTDAYDLGPDFSPNTSTTEFNWEEGEFEMTLSGRVPASASAAAKNIDAVSLAGPSGSRLDKLTITATSAEMSNYIELYDSKEETIQNLKAGGTDPSWISQSENVLEISQAVAAAGDVENAIALLEAIDTANAPAGSFMQMAFYPAIAVTAVVAVLFAVMFLRLRGKVSYFRLVVEDQIKDLEGLTLRASKIDRTMSSSLESVKDRLKRLVGM